MAQMSDAMAVGSYRGVNVFLRHALAYQSPFWTTFKQAQELGGNVRRGKHTCPVVFWKWLDVDDRSEPTGKRRVPMLLYYSVFNVAQCDGVTAPAIEGAPVHPAGPRPAHGRRSAAAS